MTDVSHLTGTCHCGAVHLTLPAKPEYMHDCNCSLCSTHGALWGYFDPADILVAGKTRSYTRSDRADPAVSIHFCAICGSTTHWTMTNDFARTQGTNDRMGANMRLFPSETLRGVEIRFPDGLNWNWTGDMPFRRPSEIA